jgi:hypothetical protein
MFNFNQYNIKIALLAVATALGAFFFQKCHAGPIVNLNADEFSGLTRKEQQQTNKQQQQFIDQNLVVVGAIYSRQTKSLDVNGNLVKRNCYFVIGKRVEDDYGCYETYDLNDHFKMWELYSSDTIEYLLRSKKYVRIK